ncbi:glycine--tRNA ligase subunit beta [Sphingomonas sp.]|uniref:glycine--tRNA ligase subunit beta n=1 Tax=Sphingomonas sp. TaxID=28214 RepID=UPI0038F7F4E7
MQAAARNALGRMLAEELAAGGIAAEAIDVWSTPRRLALVARGLPLETPASREEVKGPRTSAPAQALEGFLRKTGLKQDQLEERDGVWFATAETAGRPTTELLAGAVERIVRGFAWPKSMRWGDGDLRWVRPLHGIVALLGETIVPVAVDGIAAGATTVGHRFHHPGPITLGGAHDYAEKLRACHVIVDHEEREALIRDGAATAAADAGLALVADEGLVVENAGLTEWPVPLLGRFDPDFLDVPREVIVLTMRTNQKYFAVSGGEGALAPAFVCVANLDAHDGGEAIVEGNKRVLAARLSDARFFWEQDVKVPLEEQAAKLGGIVFHEKLGTVADKVERVAKLARWLVEEGIVASSPLQGRGGSRGAAEGEGASPSSLPLSPALSPEGERGKLADQAERAARLAKADLVTGMVGEFPELQGVIGGYLAAAQGEPSEVAGAVRDQYKPVGQGDEVPTAPVTVAVSLADKLDTLFAFFAVGLAPTGSKDPYAVRRAALAVLQLIISNDVRTRADRLLKEAEDQLSDTLNRSWSNSDTADFWDLYAEEANYRVKDVDGRAWLFHADTPMVPLGESFAQQQELMDVMMARVAAATDEIIPFLVDRLKVQQREAGVRHDLIDAVFALGGEDDLVRLLARVTALQAFVETGEGADLVAGYKRAANILKKQKWEAVLGSTADVEPAEAALDTALAAAEPTAKAAVADERFGEAMAALASLRAPIDAFFDQVKVNADDAAVRARRLNLLARFRDAVHSVADFSKIEG